MSSQSKVEGTPARRRAGWLVWTLALLYMAIIWTLSSMSQPWLPEAMRTWRDLWLHFFEYSALGMLLAQALASTWPGSSWRRQVIVALSLAVLWGAIDELHQSFVPGRTPDGRDLAADAVGAAFGVALRGLLAWALSSLGHGLAVRRQTGKV